MNTINLLIGHVAKVVTISQNRIRVDNKHY